MPNLLAIRRASLYETSLPALLSLFWIWLLVLRFPPPLPPDPEPEPLDLLLLDPELDLGGDVLIPRAPPPPPPPPPREACWFEFLLLLLATYLAPPIEIVSGLVS